MKHTYFRHIIGLIILSAIVVASFIGLLFFGKSVEHKVQLTKEMTAKLALYERNRAQYEEESNMVKDLQNRAAALSTALVTTETIPNVLSRLEELAVAQNIFFEIQNVQTPFDANKQKKMLITFRARGQRNAVQQYFDELQHQPFLVHITNFSLATYEGEGSVIGSNDWMGIATIEMQSFTGK